MTLEAEPQPFTNLCICVINTEGEIVGSYIGDPHNIKGRLNLLRQFSDTPGVKFQTFPVGDPSYAMRGYPELFFPWEETPEEEKEELGRRDGQIKSLESQLQGNSRR